MDTKKYEIEVDDFQHRFIILMINIILIRYQLRLDKRGISFGKYRFR